MSLRLRTWRPVRPHVKASCSHENCGASNKLRLTDWPWTKARNKSTFVVPGSMISHLVSGVFFRASEIEGNVFHIGLLSLWQGVRVKVFQGNVHVWTRSSEHTKTWRRVCVIWILKNKIMNLLGFPEKKFVDTLQLLNGFQTAFNPMDLRPALCLSSVQSRII